MTTPVIELNGSTPMKIAPQPTVVPQPQVYGKILLQLTNCLLPEEKLSPTPSELDGLDKEVETDLRILGCELIQTAGMLLKLPQVSWSYYIFIEVASQGLTAILCAICTILINVLFLIAINASIIPCIMCGKSKNSRKQTIAS